MGMINKHANLYDKDGNLIRRVNEDGILENYTIPELEKLVDKLSKEEDKRTEYENALRVLISMYNTKQGKEYQQKIISSLTENATKKSDSEQAVEKLQEVLEDTEEPTYNTDTNEAEYVEYEPAA